eukprot:CAMPEP_0202490440 /NCGR_PEP_ID=MMETSP1361-20130828/7844_1 /ASSEMBLY_ACC=CAM_ASM_000849 /TAXON_ID=210615 /ORGANISM="Staurosira complex sp., Strain CCMP2646" /LENGTH=73 /DNA_ID=CAMNT_0049120325 /DNA_START=668 /DNA_END=886 /DNA_ORIENTATION=+
MQNAGEKAEEFLYRTQEEHDSGNEDVKPDDELRLCDRGMGKTGGSDKCTKGRRNLKHTQKQHDEGVIVAERLA